MSLLTDAADTAIAIFRSVLMIAALLLGVVCIIDWAVRTRRISPFNGVARFFRTTVDPLIAPIERRVVRAGGSPASAPWWALVAVLVGGFLLLSLLEFIRFQLINAVMLTRSGPAGLARLVISAIFSILRIAVIVRMIASWLPISQLSRWVRWSYRLSEPVLAPLRQFVPTLGGIDITPLIAYFLLGLIESAIFHVFQLM